MNRFKTLSKGLDRTRGSMNQTEALYAHELKLRQYAGEILAWWFEPLTLRLSHPDAGQPAKYTPDFMVLYPDGVTELIDVKGSGLDSEASIVRLKCAAELFPLWRFVLVRRQTKKQGGGFSRREV